MNNINGKTNRKTMYECRVQDRCAFRYYVGLIIRWGNNLKYGFSRFVARRKGAFIGRYVIIPWQLARKANKNLRIGDHSLIQTNLIDLRNKVTIGSNVIIGSETEIITTSHNIDSVDFEHKNYGIEIEDYVWICVKVIVLPSCSKIGTGAVISSGSVVVKDVQSMSVMSGNPAVEIRKRKLVHSDLIVESLLGGDYKMYKQMRKELKR